ncbi:gag-polypeptide of LTR copia-type [Fragilaria crotonensis]|nr:gag-polypeptide of LTR copia-type [Fragilaria crotonensis]
MALIYWRRRPRMDLPEAPFPSPHSTSANALPALKYNPGEPIAFSDSDWGSDFSHRRSISGMIIMLSGAAIVYKTRYQKAVALSSTEAEFVAAADTGKMILYIRSLLRDLGFLQPTPTKLHMDNTGAVFMVEAQAPTKRTRHVDIRYFALLDWSTTGQLTAAPIRTDMNISDSMTKATGRIKFHQHADVYMGRIPPTYVTDIHPNVKPVYLHALFGCRTQPLLYALRHSPTSRLPLWFAFVSESMGG